MGIWRGVAGTTWLLLTFGVLVLVGGVIAMKIVAEDVTGDAVVALTSAVLGVIGTHKVMCQGTLSGGTTMIWNGC
jgi:hypothetical protein